jgi:hypothetical protein
MGNEILAEVDKTKRNGIFIGNLQKTLKTMKNR